jgi:hypothetical protein
MACRLVDASRGSDWVGRTADLRGETETGQKVMVRKGLVTRTHRRLEDGGLSASLKLTCTDATVGTLERGAVSFRYGLANLRLDGNEGYREERPGGFRMDRQSRFNLGGVEVVIRCLPDSGITLDEIQATRGIGVTATATVAAGPGTSDEVDELMHRLCLLLSLGLGRGIAWVYRETLDDAGHVMEILHGSAITKPWSVQELVPTANIEDFVSSSYARFQAAYEPWGLRNAILAFTDAKVEADFLELRALKMVVVMEFLRGSYLRKNGREFLIPETEFKSRLKALQERTRPVLEELFPGYVSEPVVGGDPVPVIEGLLRNVQGLNRPSFGRAFAGMCLELGVHIPSKERRRFIDIRDSLVHRMAFLVSGDSNSQYAQYAFVSTVIGKILLAILGWQGEYRDWVNGPNTVRRLELTPSRRVDE